MTDTRTAPTPTSAGSGAPPRRPATLDLPRVLKGGALGAITMAFIATNGMLEAFDRRLLIVPIISFGYAVLFVVPFMAGYLVPARRPSPGQPVTSRGPIDLVAGALTGLLCALGPAALVALLATDLDVRFVFPSLGPVVSTMLQFGRGGTGLLLLTAGCVVLGLLGASLRLLSRRQRRAAVIGLETVAILSLIELISRQILGGIGLRSLHQAIFVSSSGLRVVPAIVILVLTIGLAYVSEGRGARLRTAVARQSTQSRAKTAIAGVIALAVLIGLPTLLGSLVNELLVNVGLFMLMALGLNIVIGYAGMLDLGYVAFFAVGAYATAVLTSPLSPTFAPELTWLAALPIVIGLAALSGLFIGTPVIRLRGDYLAIVTLGFGEIIRILFLSDWLRPYFGGAQGIQRIGGVELGFVEVRGTDPLLMFYATAFFVLVAAYASWRLQDSRIGRAWAAIREDETTAQTMGVNTTRAKLLAFVSGAILASFAGALFGAKVGTVFPNSFELLVSIIILVVVIVGGMGHIPGVMVGAIVLIGVLGGPTQPGILAELGEYKLLIYGAVLVFMMLERPEGLLPSVRRSRELHQEEFSQDAWFDKRGNVVSEHDRESREAEGADPAGGTV